MRNKVVTQRAEDKQVKPVCGVWSEKCRAPRGEQTWVFHPSHRHPQPPICDQSNICVTHCNGMSDGSCAGTQAAGAPDLPGDPVDTGSKVTRQGGVGGAQGSSWLPLESGWSGLESSEAASCQMKSETLSCVCGLAPLSCSSLLYCIFTHSHTITLSNFWDSDLRNC